MQIDSFESWCRACVVLDALEWFARFAAESTRVSACPECSRQTQRSELSVNEDQGAGYLCTGCVELHDESTYEQHADDDLPGACPCMTCRRHRMRLHCDDLTAGRRESSDIDLDDIKF